jgi:hypothetical protein
MPWHLIDRAIDGTFNYTVTDDVKARWVAQTCRAFDNTDDNSRKTLNCPVCNTRLEIPWTTCNAAENVKATALPGLIGSGYGDGNFEFACHGCAAVLNRELLSVAKFSRDTRDLLVKGLPMPGTILSPRTGKPESWKTRSNAVTFAKLEDELRLPNRVIQQVLRIQIHELLDPQKIGQRQVPPSMETVRQMFEDALKDRQAMRNVIFRGKNKLASPKLPPTSHVAVRRMMSRYWDNSSPFALELGSAVHRQTTFTDKMYKLDWLHSPVAADTMQRCCTKYARFLGIMEQNAAQLCVPTLDVDLAWQ